MGWLLLFKSHMLLARIRTSLQQVNPVSRRSQLALSGLALLLLLGSLWWEFNHTENLGTLWSTFLNHLQTSNGALLAGAIVLMPLNWFVETLKWRQYVLRFEPISLKRALLAVWVGVSFSLFTPNRIGEYGGRVLFIRPQNRWKAVLINLIGNYSQYLILLSLGSVAGIFYLSALGILTAFWLYVFCAGAALALLFLYLLYFNIRRMLPLLRRVSKRGWWRALQREGEVLHYFNTTESVQLLGWALLRYVIYSTQYFLLLLFFGIKPGLLVAYTGIALLFLLQTCLPLAPLASLLVRGNLAIWVWLPFGENALSALASSFALWIINLILPALIGTFSLFHVNIDKQRGYEDD